MKLEHIGIAVKDLADAEELYTTLLDTPPYKREEVLSQLVTTSFFQTGEAKVELLAAMNEESVITNFINKKGTGIHHLAFEVEDINAEMERLKSLGFRLLSEVPKRGADNKLVCFVHPKDCGGVLWELCQTL